MMTNPNFEFHDGSARGDREKGGAVHAVKSCGPIILRKGRRELGFSRRPESLVGKPLVYVLLNDRGMTLKLLAALAGVSRAHLSLILRNKPGRGGQVRRKVAPYLTCGELAVLGWNAEGERL